MADHIAFAVQRLQKGEKISNPLTEDIKTLFHSEFKVASMIQTILKEEKQIDIDEDEIGYVALHIHSALEKESVSVSMQMARAVRDCVSVIEEQRGIRTDFSPRSARAASRSTNWRCWWWRWVSPRRWRSITSRACP